MSVFVVDLVAKLSLLLVLGLCINALLFRAPAALRYAVLLATLVGSVLLPGLMSLSPKWDVAVLPAFESATADNSRPAAMREPFPANRVATQIAPRDVRSGSVLTATPSDDSMRVIPARATLLALLWIGGAFAVLMWLAIGHLRLKKIARRSARLDDPEWRRLFAAEKRKTGIERNVLLLCSPDVNTPITWGVSQPVVVLPEDAFHWTVEHRSVVLAHELAHVARQDARSQLFAGIACALYWFHPLVWLTERRLRAECERACDDRVVAGGTPGSVYATHLLEVARSARSFGGPGFLSVAMARTSELEGRLLAVLNNSKSRDTISGAQKIGVIVVTVVLVMSVSGFRPVPRVAATPRPRIQAVTNVTPLRVTPLGGRDVESPMKEIAGSPGADSVFSQSVAAQPGGTLTLDLPVTGGTITISGWDEQRVQVNGRMRSPNSRAIEATLEATGDGVRLRTVYRGNERNTSFSHTFDIRVPRQFNVRLSSSAGGITITDVTGSFTGNTGAGEIVVRNARGSLDLHTGGGDVRVTRSALNGNVSTGGGAVRIEGNDGNLNGDSGTGDVSNSTSTTNTDTRYGTVTTKSRGATASGTTTFMSGDSIKFVSGFGSRGTQIRRSGGNVSLEEAPDGARLITGGGYIRLGRSAGEVFASTGGGNIDIGPASGSVIATTGAGDVAVRFAGDGYHAGDISTGLGEAVVVIPDNFSGTLVLESAYTNNFPRKTRIRSDWPIDITETSDWDSSAGTPRRYVRAQKTFGTGGGTVRVQTVNGDVIVRRVRGTR